MARRTEEKFWNAPNLITLTRVALVPVFALMLFQKRPFGALLVIFLAGLSDVLDGFAARRWHQRTKIGTLIDPLADKLLLSAAYILLAIGSLGFTHVIPLWLTAVVIGRDFIIVAGALAVTLVRGRREFPPSVFGKISTVLQVATVFWVTLSNYVSASALTGSPILAAVTSPSVLSAFYIVTLALTVISGAVYIYKGMRMIIRLRPFSYRTSILVMRTFPVCPRPEAIGLSNIPRNEPTIFVYNHRTARVEPLFLALAAPTYPPIRFFVDIKVARPAILPETLKDVRNSLFSHEVQEKLKKHPLRRKMMESVSRLITLGVTVEIKGYNFIPVYVHEVRTPEDEALRRRVNWHAIQDCIKALENNVPVAIAPSGGYTHQETKRNSVPTTLPTLAEILQKRGKTLKIVPSVIKERPPVSHGTFKRYIADRILPYRLFRLLLDRLKIKRYDRPRLTVEFLPPVTFPYTDSSKEDKIRFVRHLQQIMYDVLNRD